MLYSPHSCVTMIHLASCLLLLLFCLVGITQPTRNNVCTSFVGYNFKDWSKSCYHDPDADTLDPITIARHHVPEVETYDITTEDGYILTMLRLPKEDPKGVLWMQHPITADGTVWILASNDSLAFLAWNAGFDVWMPSQRGTLLSPGHVTMSEKDFKYWDFSFHEIAISDYRSLAKFIYDKTNGTQLIYVGHSMSSTASLVYASTFPEEAQQYVKIFINMATPVYFQHTTFYLKMFAYLEWIFKPLSNFFKIGGVFRHNDWHVKLYRLLASRYPGNLLTAYLFSIAGGWTPSNYDPRALGLTVPKFSRGLSARILLHYFQLCMVQDRFQQYDYGKRKNKELYGTERPPTYDLQRIKTPFHFVCTNRDIIGTHGDIQTLYASLPKAAQHGTYLATNINHIDYFFGKNKKEKIYDHVIDYISTV